MDQTPLTADEIAEWLALAPGEQLDCTPLDPALPGIARDRQRTGCALMAGGMLLAFGGLIASIILELHPAWGMCSFFGGIVVLMAGAVSLGASQQTTVTQPWLLQGDSVITADATGLTVTTGAKTQFVGWTAVAALDPVYGAAGDGGVRRVERWKLTADDARTVYLRADAPHIEQLLTAARGVVAARAAGRELWDPGSVPQTGLSRMTGETEADDASISRADGR